MAESRGRGGWVEVMAEHHPAGQAGGRKRAGRTREKGQQRGRCMEKGQE